MNLKVNKDIDSLDKFVTKIHFLNGNNLRETLSELKSLLEDESRDTTQLRSFSDRVLFGENNHFNQVYDAFCSVSNPNAYQNILENFISNLKTRSIDQAKESLSKLLKIQMTVDDKHANFLANPELLLMLWNPEEKNDELQLINRLHQYTNEQVESLIYAIVCDKQHKRFAFETETNELMKLVLSITTE